MIKEGEWRINSASSSNNQMVEIKDRHFYSFNKKSKVKTYRMTEAELATEKMLEQFLKERKSNAYV